MHYSIRTEDAYVLWARRFILFHGKRHPLEMGEAEVGAFLTHLAVRADVAASTQNQALAASAVPLQGGPGPAAGVGRRGRPGEAARAAAGGASAARRSGAVLAQLDGKTWLAAGLLYGSGLRLMECLRLRVKDVDFGQGHIVVRDGKGQKDRVTLLPERSREPLAGRSSTVPRPSTRGTSAEGFGRVYLPHALARKYPEADRQPGWQYVFPAARRALDPRWGVVRRHHLAESALQKAVEAGRPPRRDRQAGQLPHLPPQLRHPPARSRLGHPHRPGIARPQGRPHHDDLHPRPAGRPPGRPQPARPILRPATGPFHPSCKERPAGFRESRRPPPRY